MTESVAQRAIALIQDRGVMRTDTLTEELGVDRDHISKSLWYHCQNGTLVSCRVERPSGIAVNEYRMSASGKGKDWRSGPGERRPPTPPRAGPAADAASPPDGAGAAKRKAAKASTPRRPKTATARKSIARVRRDTRLAVPLVAGAHRWALASDGAFLLLGTEIEIPRTAAGALVEFIRALDGGEIAQARRP